MDGYLLLGWWCTWFGWRLLLLIIRCVHRYVTSTCCWQQVTNDNAAVLPFLAGGFPPKKEWSVDIDTITPLLRWTLQTKQQLKWICLKLTDYQVLIFAWLASSWSWVYYYTQIIHFRLGSKILALLIIKATITLNWMIFSMKLRQLMSHVAVYAYVKWFDFISRNNRANLKNKDFAVISHR